MYIFTKQITSAFTLSLTANDSVTAISVKSASAGGSVTVLGTFPFKGLTPSAMTFTDGEGVTLTAPSTASPLDGITITWVSGTVFLTISVQ